MAKNRRRTSSRRNVDRSAGRTGFPGWLWLLMGLAIGVLIASYRPMMSLIQGKDRPLTEAEPAQAAATTASPAVVQTTVQSPVTLPPAAPQTPADAATNTAPVLTLTPPADANPDDHKFEFYYRLPQERVVVQQDDVKDVIKSEAPLQDPAKPSSNAGSYLIQAGSFRSNADADRRKAQLALLGLIARIEKITTDSGTWYRVRLGPFQSLNEANRVQSELHSQQIKTLLVNVSGR